MIKLDDNDYDYSTMVIYISSAVGGIILIILVTVAAICIRCVRAKNIDSNKSAKVATHSLPHYNV